MNAHEKFADLYGPYFSHGEFRCKCPTCMTMRTDDTEWFTTAEFKTFMAVLVAMRGDLCFPFKINSGYRCPDYNDSLYVAKGHEPGGHRDGPHTIGAADIGCSFERAYRLIKLATNLDLGVGPVQTGLVAARFVHVDNLGPRFWTY